MSRITLVFTLLVGTSAACRPDPGDYDYASQEDFTSTDNRLADGDPGIDPYVEGSARLSFGIFYEGRASQTLLVDEITRHYFIYDNTFSQLPDSDHIEGKASDVIVHAGGSWWGGGITWDAAEDLSDWTTLVVGLKSADEGFASVGIAMESDTRAVVNATRYGYQDDGEWHLLRIPVSAFTDGGVDLGAVVQPFGLAGGAADSGARLNVDSVYFTQE